MSQIVKKTGCTYIISQNSTQGLSVPFQDLRFEQEKFSARTQLLVVY